MVSLVAVSPQIVEIGNGMLSHLNTSLQETYVVSRAKYNNLVKHQFGHNATPVITSQVRHYLKQKNYLMQPQGRGFVVAYMKPNQSELVSVDAAPAPAPKVNPRVCRWASPMIRLRDSFVEDFEHNRHTEYVVDQAAFEQRILTFYRTAFDGRFKNMFRDLMKGVNLKVSFLAGNVYFTKPSVVVVKKKSGAPAPSVQVKIPKKEWAGIIKQAVGRIGDRMKHSATFTVVVSHPQFRELITFWPSKPEFIDQLNKALVKEGYKVEVGKSVVRVSFDKIAQRDSEQPKVKPARAPKVEKPIAKVFNAQALFAVIDKSFREAMGDISQLRWADDYTHTVTLAEYDTDRSDGQFVHFVEEDIRIAGRNVDELFLRRGDIVLTNDAGAKQFRKAVRHVNSAPCRMCKVTKLKF